MKIPSISLTSRFTLTATLITIALAAVFVFVIRFIDNMEEVIHEKSTEHINSLTENSLITRKLFQLSNHVQFLEQNIIDNEETLTKEGLFINAQLQSLRNLSKNKEFIGLINTFINDFHRFMGSSLSLNSIFKESYKIDQTLNNNISVLEKHIKDNHQDYHNTSNEPYYHCLLYTSPSPRDRG